MGAVGAVPPPRPQNRGTAANPTRLTSAPCECDAIAASAFGRGGSLRRPSGGALASTAAGGPGAAERRPTENRKTRRRRPQPRSPFPGAPTRRRRRGRHSTFATRRQPAAASRVVRPTAVTAATARRAIGDTVGASRRSRAALRGRRLGRRRRRRSGAGEVRRPPGGRRLRRAGGWPSLPAVTRPRRSPPPLWRPDGWSQVPPRAVLGSVCRLRWRPRVLLRLSSRAVGGAPHGRKAVHP